MATFFKLVAPIGLLTATACTSVDHGLGEAVKYNMAVQTIDPEPVYPPDGAQPGDNAEVGVGAVRRYLQGTVKEVVPATTTSGAGGAGTSSGPK